MGNPHAGFDEAGAGNGLLRTAPAFDPTLGGLGAAMSPGYPVLGDIWFSVKILKFPSIYLEVNNAP